MDNLIAGNEFERVEKLYIPKKVLNKTDQTIETDLGRLKITDIKILKKVSYHPDFWYRQKYYHLPEVRVHNFHIL